MDPNGDGDPSDGIDGWRLDVSAEVPDGFWRDWNALVASVNPQAYTVAEEWGDATDYLRRTGFQSTMNYHALAIPTDAFLWDGRQGAAAFADTLVARFDAYPEATRAGLFNLYAGHDTDRLASMIVNGALGANYDREAGPRQTDRYAVRAPTAAERDIQRLAVTLQMALPGVPMVYYGDEAGMWGADDPDDRQPMVWPDLTYADQSHDPLGRPRAPDPVQFDHDAVRLLPARHRPPQPATPSSATAVCASSPRTRPRSRSPSSERSASSAASSRSTGATGASFSPSRRARRASRSSRSSPRPATSPRSQSSCSSSRRAARSGGVGLRLPPRTAVVFRTAAGPDVRPNGLHE